ncbi:UbiH/UbiF family hydroxylase [Shinella daejeonensis]|uniref:UbiH/UbiF family hydroxylase n=1 Tax=Shinella daejeonensis TaxID=659017 RepID=UPI0020C817AA|nr:UbiH/UbiF family hydroxylase [Shinella daejeonensis]MCP8893384.1 UbiH/UbiF family hydroxylase [Shinella daejeonensis]
MKEFDIAVVGAGLAGSLAALALAEAGRRVALVAPPAHAGDGRTTALMDQSIAFLKRLGIWEAVAPHAAPLEAMRILDGTSRLLRAPAVTFRAREVGLDAFGYNIPNAPFIALLEERIAARPEIERVTAGVTALTFHPDHIELTPADGERLTTRFVIGADGRRSLVREAAGIGVKSWSYPQTALVLNFSHERPHGNASCEFHTESGPFTQVPLPGDRSSLVWVLPPPQADVMRRKTADEIARAIEDRMQSMLGKVALAGDVQSFPLSGMTAERFGRGRVALIGEAGHAFPPIGAQGLNLSLRDIIALEDLLRGGGAYETLGDRFDRRRRADVRSRTASVDLLNRSLLSDFLPVQFLRAAGLHLLGALGPLRGLAMREGIEPGGALKAFREEIRQRLDRRSA